MKRRRTLVFLIETEMEHEEEVLKPHIINALRQYADELEAGSKGISPVEEQQYGKSILRVVHGVDEPCQ